MTKLNTLKTSKEFQRLRFSKKRWVTPNIIMQIANNGNKGKRFGFIITKKVGNAVVRNRIKRQLRAIIQLNILPMHKNNIDCVIIANKLITQSDFTRLKQDILNGIDYLISPTKAKNDK